MTINKTIEDAKAQAKKDLEAKNKRINNFEKDLNKFFKQISKDFSAIYHATGQTIDLNETYKDELDSLLKSNYREIQSDFSDQIRKQIDEVASEQNKEPIPEKKNELDAKIAMALGAFVLVKASTITPKVIKTTQDTIKQLTSDYIANQALNGVNVGKEQVAKEVGKQIKTWGKEHAPVIAVTETQTTVGKTKQIEALEVEKIITGVSGNAGSIKTWITHGDEKVRASHQVLDGTSKPFAEYFVSGHGNNLMYSGDIENAPLSDVINCRCSTIYRYNASTVNIVINHIYKRKGWA